MSTRGEGFCGAGQQSWAKREVYFSRCHWSQDMRSIMSGCVGEISHKYESNVTTEAAYDSWRGVMRATEVSDVGQCQGAAWRARVGVRRRAGTLEAGSAWMAQGRGECPSHTGARGLEHWAVASAQSNF